MIICSYRDASDFEVTLLQRVQFHSKSMKRSIVLFCDSRFTTNINAQTSSRITMPSFSCVIVDVGGNLKQPAIIVAIVMFSFNEPGNSRRRTRIRFQVAPLRRYIGFSSYLPYDTLEHDDERGGVKLMWISPSSLYDGHFLVPIQGLRNSVTYDTLPNYASYNIREGTRLYYSLKFEDYDVGKNSWSARHTERMYSTVRSSDKNQELVHRDRKVFLPPEALSAMQTQFGFDDDDAKDRPYRNGPRKVIRQQDQNEDDRTQTKMSMYYSAKTASSLGSVHAGGGSFGAPSMESDIELDPMSEEDQPDPFDDCIDDVGADFEFNDDGSTD